MSDLSSLANAVRNAPSTPRMPALFIGHGNPMHAITKNPFATAWERYGRNLPRPKAVLCISAHWETAGTRITAMPAPRTIHDLGGFPQELFDVVYPAPGNRELAATIVSSVTAKTIELDHTWGLDHGAWSVLRRMYPKADIPVMQLSLDMNMSPQQHVNLANDLALLRRRGILIVGSGNIVHNLGRMRWEGPAYDWAKDFDNTSKRLIETRDITSLTNYQTLGTAARMAIPTSEHYLPLLYVMGVADNKDELTFFNESIDLGSVSMRSMLLSGAS
jgi:4,5-DOPA dioxygenase extradiol